MKKLVILGAGTAGTMMASHLRKKLSKSDWEITIIDQCKPHYYQPGFLFLPFDTYKPEDVKKSIDEFIPKGVKLIREKIDVIDKDSDTVVLDDGKKFKYNILILATGTKTAPGEVAGMLGEYWYKSIFDFYTYEGALALRDKLRLWKGGKLVVHITEMPIKCPVAPLEFAFLADSFFIKKGMRDKVDITYVTPLSGAFTKEKCTTALTYLLNDKNIKIVPDFAVEHIDGANGKIVDYGGEEVPFDLLVTIPTNMGDELMARSGIGNELNYVPTDKNTLQTKVKENIFALGDCTDVPASKAGSVAHFQAEILTENILLYIKGKELKPDFDGHANCFIETGHGKALLIDFNYEFEPVKGKFPFAGIGPLNLLTESRLNHWGKLAFRWIYWNMLLPARKLPFITPKMSKSGKNFN
ncbi:type III sulfide quinone reductase, selenoprotein subtype [Flavobacterium franklandianum]|uniref:NAD(P)/FAD-dependent oxidoreductase n=1 Tax=Flavobacterium franklandianum TaxID=2594430 RepID=A0A553CMM8_9FLAO|nr:FAD/NAD(P)-binding oxidoreductase [Flavobacterium franklandianum]TRX21694.1 NAD(P)/FAD-dependent oxidoreductase [Flavobacterium franklandianum]